MRNSSVKPVRGGLVRRNVHRRLESAELRTALTNEKFLAPFDPPGRFGTSIRYQFIDDGALVANVSYASLLNLICVTKTATTAASIIEAVKVNRLRVWVMGKTSPSASSVGEIPNSVRISIRDGVIPGVGVEKDVLVTCIGSAGNYWEYKPKGFMANWFNGTAVGALGELMFVITQSDSVQRAMVQIDVGLQITVAASMVSGAALALQTTVDTTTAGSVAYPPLDSLADGDTEGTAVLIPMSVQTVTVNMPRPEAPVLPSLLVTQPVMSSSSGVRRRA